MNNSDRPGPDELPQQTPDLLRVQIIQADGQVQPVYEWVDIREVVGDPAEDDVPACFDEVFDIGLHVAIIERAID